MDSLKKAYLPELNDCGGDLSKDWFVYFSYRHPVKRRMVRFREYKGFSALRTKSERYDYAKKIIRNLGRRLRNGWNPFQDDKVLYDSPEQKQVVLSGKSIEQQLLEVMKKSFTGDNPKTLTNYECIVRHFINYLQERKFADADLSIVSEDHAEDFLDSLNHKGLSNKTRNEHRSLLKKLFSILLRKKKILSNPFEFCVNKKHYAKPREYFRDQIRKTLLDDISQKDPYLLFFIELTYYLMRRRTELSKLRVRNINMEKGVFVFNEEIAKTGEQDAVTIPMQLFEKLVKMELHKFPGDFFLLSSNQRPSVKPIGVNYFYKRWVKYRNKYGLKEYGLYNWKHTAAVSMIDAQFEANLIKEHAGWNDLKMVELYTKSYSLKSSPLIRDHYPDIRSSTGIKLFPNLQEPLSQLG